MRRNTSKALGLLLLMYIVGQSIVLFYGQVARITLFKKVTHRNVHVHTTPTMSPVQVISHHVFAENPAIVVDKSVMSLGNASAYINVDLNTVQDVVQKSKVYYAFEFRVPNFGDNRSSELFYKRKGNLEVLQRQPTQLYGELYVVRNGTYETKFDCGYKSLNTWVNKDRKVAPGNWHDVLVPLIVPDGHTFQHFIDGTLPKIVQALPVLRDRRTKILMRSFRDKIIFEMFDRLNISRNQLVFQSGGVVGANILVFPCITPPVHPELWQEARRLLTAGNVHLQIPRDQAYVIFITRKGCHNCGRKVLNQESVVDMLTKRYGADAVKTFNGPITLAESVALFSKAKIIMGPHGGGMYNINFAPFKTTVIEFMPTKNDGELGAAAHTIIWHQAQLLDQDYWRMSITPQGKNDMNVNLTTLEHILDVVDKRSGR